MRDIHSHLLFSSDDGTTSIKESINIIKKLATKGITDIILTPHYIEETKYSEDNITKESKLLELKKELKKAKIKTNLYLGNEIFISPNIKELIEKKEITTLAGSMYVLIEFSLFYKNDNNDIILDDLLKSGYIPVLAHPERYTYYKDIKYFEYLVSKGILLQGNLLSLVDPKRKKTLTKLLKNNLIHFLATDIHQEYQIDLIDTAMSALNKIISKEKQDELLNINGLKIMKYKKEESEYGHE